MGKKKTGFQIILEDRHCSGLTDEQLGQALDTFARFVLNGVLMKLDPGGRIPIEDCSISGSTASKSAFLSISIIAERDEELLSAYTSVYGDILSQIERYGIDELIAAGRRADG